MSARSNAPKMDAREHIITYVPARIKQEVEVRVYTEANGSIDDDVATATEGIGLARAAYRSRDPLAMAPAINVAYSGVQGLLAERELLMRRNGQGVYGGLFE